jgi:hypothetical protein
MSFLHVMSCGIGRFHVGESLSNGYGPKDMGPCHRTMSSLACTKFSPAPTCLNPDSSRTIACVSSSQLCGRQIVQVALFHHHGQQCPAHKVQPGYSIGSLAAQRLQIDIIDLLARLPVQMIAILCFFDATPDSACVTATPQDLTKFCIDCESFPLCLERCAELSHLILRALNSAPESRKRQAPGQDWAAMKVRQPAWQSNCRPSACISPQIARLECCECSSQTIILSLHASST